MTGDLSRANARSKNMAKAVTTPWDPADHLRTDEDMAAKLDAALEEGDLNLVAAALGLQLHAAPAAPKGAV
jgi:DNA-binding phage protein